MVAALHHFWWMRGATAKCHVVKGDGWRLKTPPTPALSAQNRRTGTTDDLYRRRGRACAQLRMQQNASGTKASLFLLSRCWKAASGRKRFFFCLTRRIESLLLFLGTNGLGCVSFLSEPSPSAPRIHHVGASLLSHVLRETGLMGGGRPAIKNGGESDWLIRRAESAESALTNTHPRTYFPWGTVGFLRFYISTCNRNLMTLLVLVRNLLWFPWARSQFLICWEEGSGWMPGCEA